MEMDSGKNMRFRNKRGILLQEAMCYIILSAFVLAFAIRLYTGSYLEYRRSVSFLKHTDYAYYAFERIKEDLYSNTESVLLVDNIVYITKDSRVNGRFIKLYQSGERLRYTLGSTGFTDSPVHYLCYDLKDVRFRIMGRVLFIRLEFSDVSYERGYRLDY